MAVDATESKDPRKTSGWEDASQLLHLVPAVARGQPTALSLAKGGAALAGKLRTGTLRGSPRFARRSSDSPLYKRQSLEWCDLK
jgi:hypothetical protein